jgi:hypothetical protein
MSMRIALEYDSGETVEETVDENRVFLRLRPKDDGSSHCLVYVDPYLVTWFNCLQMPQLIKELTQLKQTAMQNDQQLIDHIILMAMRCSQSPGMVIKFDGD